MDLNDLWLVIPLILILLSLKGADALKVLVMFIAIGVGVWGFLYARVHLGMSWEALSAMLDGWLTTALVLLGTMVAMFIPPVVLSVLRRRREQAEK